MDGYLQQAMVEFTSQEELLIYILDHNQVKQPEPLLKVSLKLSDFIQLDNGAAYLGFT